MKQLKFFHLFLFLFLFIIIISCFIFLWKRENQISDRQFKVPQFPVSGRKWTFAFYLAGDNSLEHDQIKHLKEICNSASVFQDAHIIVFFDRDDDITHDNILTSWKGTRVFYINGTNKYEDTIKNPLTIPLPNSITTDHFEYLLSNAALNTEEKNLLSHRYIKQGKRYYLINLPDNSKDKLSSVLTDKVDYLLPLKGKEYANLNATEGKTLTQFMNFVKDNFISDYYALIMTGHGNGWLAEDTLPPVSQRTHSDEYYRNLKVSEIKNALMDNPVDVLILDICSMGDIETAWALRDSSNYLVFNQTTIPSMGLNYTIQLAKLGSLKDIKPKDVAFQTVEVYRQTYQDKQYVISSTAIDLGMDFKDFVYTFQGYVQDESHIALLKTAAKQATYVTSRSLNREKMIDLTKYILFLKVDQLNRHLINNTFIVNQFSNNTDNRGISLYLPKTKDIYLQNGLSYKETDFAKDFPQGWVHTLPSI